MRMIHVTHTPGLHCASTALAWRDLSRVLRKSAERDDFPAGEIGDALSLVLERESAYHAAALRIGEP